VTSEPFGPSSPAVPPSLEGTEGGSLMPPPLPVVDLTDPASGASPVPDVTVSAPEPIRTAVGEWTPIPTPPAAPPVEPIAPAAPAEAVVPPVVIDEPTTPQIPLLAAAAPASPASPAAAAAPAPAAPPTPPVTVVTPTSPVSAAPEPVSPDVTPDAAPAASPVSVATPVPAATPAAVASPVSAPSPVSVPSPALPEAPVAPAPIPDSIFATPAPQPSPADAPTLAAPAGHLGGPPIAPPVRPVADVAPAVTPDPAPTVFAATPLVPPPGPNFRQAQETRVIAPTDEAAALEAARTARAKALGEVAPTPDVVTAPELFHLPSTYNKFPSLMLFLLRLVVIALMGIRVWQDTSPLSATIATWENTLVPDAYAKLAAYSQIGVEALIALLLLFGLGSRLAGALTTILAVTWLALVLWGVGSPFDAAGSGVVFAGEFQVLLAAVGLVLLGVGTGGWLTLDSFFHRARIERKNQRVN
jgi:hypothetical protein